MYRLLRAMQEEQVAPPIEKEQQGKSVQKRAEDEEKGKWSWADEKDNFRGWVQKEAKALWDLGYSKFPKMRVEEAFNIPDLLSLGPMKIRIHYDELEVRVGTSTRGLEFFYNLKTGVTNPASGIEVPPAMQNTGISGQVMLLQIPFMEDIGVTRRDATAVDVGSYIWTTYGYEADETSLSRVYKDMLKYFPFIEAAMPEEPDSIHNIALLDISMPVVDAYIEAERPYAKEMDLAASTEAKHYVEEDRFLFGKWYLIKYSGGWNGYLDITNPTTKTMALETAKRIVQKAQARAGGKEMEVQRESKEPKGTVPTVDQDRAFRQVARSLGKNVIVLTEEDYERWQAEQKTPKRMAASKEGP